MRTGEALRWPIAPMKATTGRLPSGGLWVFEPKWDGHRVLVRVRRGSVDAVSSTGQPRLDRWPWLAEIAPSIGSASAILDGEVIAAGDDGKHSFQSVGRVDRAHTFVVFDILSLDDEALVGHPWNERRKRLEATLRPTSRAMITPVTDDGEALIDATRATGFEGVIAKRVDSIYRPGDRSRNWVKVKHRDEQEFVIGGYMTGEGSRSNSFGSLLLGVYEQGELRFAGAVGSGFTDSTLAELRRLLHPRATGVSPFQPVPKLVRGRARWVTPDLVAQVSFAEWTVDGHLRHPVFQGLRDDKAPADVVRER